MAKLDFHRFVSLLARSMGHAPFDKESRMAILQVAQVLPEIS